MQYADLDQQQKHVAYHNIKVEFDLRPHQREKLDAAHSFQAIILAAHKAHWGDVKALLHAEGII